jgi:hypothetical protein
MALFDDILNGGNLATGVVVGAGALIAWLLISSIARPAAKSLIKAGLIAYQGAEQLYAGVVEGIGDIWWKPSRKSAQRHRRRTPLTGAVRAT